MDAATSWHPFSHALRIKNGQLGVGGRWIYVPTVLGLRYSEVECPGCRRTGSVDMYELDRAAAEARNRGPNYVMGRWVDNVELAVVGRLVERGTLLELVPIHTRPQRLPRIGPQSAGTAQVLHQLT